MSDQQQYPKAIVEALSPEEIALQVEQVGVAKARAGAASTLALAVMAGAFIGLGGVLAGAIAVGPEPGAGPTRLLMGLGLTMALFMVVITGAELFTGNNMMLMGLFSRADQYPGTGTQLGAGPYREPGRCPCRGVHGLLRPLVDVGGPLLRRDGHRRRRRQGQSFL